MVVHREKVFKVFLILTHVEKYKNKIERKSQQKPLLFTDPMRSGWTMDKTE